MSDHNWVLENLESYHAGGLDATERERLETHLAKCAGCSKALQEIRGMDDHLEGLFAAIRPEPGLEDRMIRSLRIGGSKSKLRLPVIGWIGLSAAAAVLLAVVGALMQNAVLGDHSNSLLASLRPPRNSVFLAELTDKSGSMAGEDMTIRFGQPVGGEKSSGRTAAKDVDVDGNIDEMASRLREETIAKVDSGKSVEFRSDGKELDDTRQIIAGQDGRLVPMDIKEGATPERKPGGELLRDPERKETDKPMAIEGKVSPDTRTIALNADVAKVAGGFALPDSHVDVYETSLKDGETKLVAQDVKIRAVDQLPAQPEDKPGTTKATVTVEANPKVAQSLIKAQDSGRKLTLFVRPFGDTSRIGEQQQQQAGQLQQQLLGGGSFSGGSGGTNVGGGSLQPGFVFGYQPATNAPAQAPGAGATPGLELTGKDANGKEAFKQLPMGGVAGVPFEAKRLEAGSADHTYRNDALAAQSNEYFRPGEQAKADVERLLKEVDKTIRAQTVTKGTSSVGSSGVVAGLQPENKGKEEQKPAKPAVAPSEPAGPRKIVIRSGDIEFEVDSFDSAVATVTLLVNKIQNGFVATVNSEKLPNGKVRGSVVVRVPPESLDGLVLDLRKELGKAGELKGQKIGSQDITKQYTDLESRLKAARAMEERLLQVIKTGKGEIKDLLAAEKELGVWRTKIEEFEGELRYYGNLVSLSTLTITLAEKEIRSPFAVIETERVQMGVEVEDVIKAQQQVLKAVEDAKGRVTKSDLKQHAADQLNALLHFEVAPEKAGPLRDRIEQLGKRTRLEIDRLQETEGGTGKPGEIKTRRKDTQFVLSLFNVANVAPRETVHLSLACVDAEDVYKKILARVETAAGRVVTSNLNQQRNDQTSGVIQFEVKSADAGAVLLALKNLGEVMRLQVTENPDAQNVTRSKQGFNVQVFALGTVAPRETATIQLATRDVPAGYRAIQDAVTKAKGRILNAQLNEQDKQNISAQLDLEIRRADEAAVAAAMTGTGDIFSRTVTRAPDSDTVVDSKVRWQVALINQDHIPPRETTTLGIEVNNVDKTAAEFVQLATASKGRVVGSDVARERTGRTTAKLIFTVPLSAAPALADKFRAAGTVRVQRHSENPQVPESDLAVARLDVTLSNAPLVPSDEGFGPELRKGLSTSVKVLSLSLSWLLFGLLVVLPWAIVIYAIYRLAMRMRRKAATVPTV
jgi:hypothetical protein